MYSLNFFPFLVSGKTHKTLTQLRFFLVILTERSPVNIDFAFKCFVEIPSVRFRFLFVGAVALLGNYFHAKFHEIVMRGSLGNSSFPRKQPVAIFGQMRMRGFNWVS